jgi:DNA-binding MarR family transcriptional regulator
MEKHGPLQEGRSLRDPHMWLYRAFHAQQNFLRPRKAQIGLGPGQPKLLGYLAVHGPSTQSDLARFFEVDAAAVSRMLDTLTRNGFVHTEQGDDRRTKRCSLTKKGHEALDAWERYCDEEREVMLKGFSPTEVTELEQLLARIHDNLAAANGDDVQ